MLANPDDGVRILTVIPARGGSKRLPMKNLKALGQRPLLEWSIEAAKITPNVCDILVSTDCQDISRVAKLAGALCPWLRPEALSTDCAKSIDVVLHALEWYQSQYGAVDGVLMLQPTSPFRSKKLLEGGVELFKQNPGCSVVGVSESLNHPMWTMKLNKDGRLEGYMGLEGMNRRSQDLPPAYTLNGNFYLTSPDNLQNNHSYFSDFLLALIAFEAEENVDIDTEFDFARAELLALDLERMKLFQSWQET